jgi:hypothetical protein
VPAVASSRRLNQLRDHLRHRAQAILVDVDQSELAAVVAGDHQHVAAQARTEPRTGTEKRDLQRPSDLAAAQAFL